MIETERLLLRVWRPEEADRLFDIRRRPEVAQWLGDPEPWTDPASVVDTIAEWKARTMGPGPFGIWAIDSGDPAGPRGSVSIGQPPGSDEIEIGWHLHPDSTGQGFASEAAAALLHHALSLGIDRVWAIMWPHNDLSARVALSIGMTDLGVVNDEWYGTEEEPTSRMFIARSPIHGGAV